MDATLFSLYFSALVAVYLLPGPDMALVVATGASRGVRMALVTSLGIALSRGMHVFMSGLGLAALMAAHPVLLDVVRWGGAAYLLFLAWQVLRADMRVDTTQGAEGSAASGFTRGLLTNLLNPKALMFCGLFLPQFVAPERGPVLLQFVWLGAILVAVGFAFDAIYAVLAARLSRRVRSASPFRKWLLPTVFVLLAGRLVAS
ncbi:LysE family translocator [Noviherbaspirillum saxi]|uniref:LysE family translocator n=1 Tax=Noviherbaspirillum saxi TaxID=2320863 RepID=A0A3A3FL86_9BURK|nr:LysE family translocator [Noviherbaspirillum saxi]RJF95225.1 LysE family translocator [Noviherbaspirillum saxi]